MVKKIKILLSQLHFSGDFRQKLRHNFHEFTILDKLVYLLFVRWFINKEERFFFEGSLTVPGQMYLKERQALYDLIINNKPRHCFEIGTYTGGGSTFFLASAFNKLGEGKVITLENDQRLFDFAVNAFKKHLSHLLPHVEFIFGDNFSYFDEYLKKYETIDYLFLDGAEDRNQTKDQYLAFSKYFKAGTILAVHDWNTEKTASLKPLIMADNNWEKIIELSAPESVGFVAFRHK